jgi:hypothetical protein
MNLKQLFLTKNNCYISGKKMVPKGIVVHSTSANNPNIGRYVGPDDGLLGSSANHWNQPKPDGREVCVHAFIGKLKDGTIATYQTLPWDMRGWHAGGSANDSYIGFEICEDALTDTAYFNAVYREAVELCAMLCKQYNIKPASPSLICHSEGYKLGIASNHADVMHWFPKFGKSMDTFRADVAKAMQFVPASGVQSEDDVLFDAMQAIGIDFDRKTWAAVLTGRVAYPAMHKRTLVERTVAAVFGRKDLSAAQMRKVLTALMGL